MNQQQCNNNNRMASNIAARGRRRSEETTSILWQQCRLTFRPSRGDLIACHYIDPTILQHMELPPIVATLDETEMSVHYFLANYRDHDCDDSDSEVECVALPISRTTTTATTFMPLVPLQRDHSSDGCRTTQRSRSFTEFY